MICIYHNRDLDGFTSGAIVKRKYPEVRLVGYDYGLPFPLRDEELIGEDVIMIDVSLPMPQMFSLALTCRHLTWIDHHISAINDYKNFPTENQGGENITAVLENGISACEGGWKYLFPDEEMPIAVKLLGEYDTWRNGDNRRWEDEILPFQFGMRQACNSPESFPEYLFIFTDKDIIESPVYGIIENGKTILKYQAQVNELMCKKAAFEMKFEGLRAICLNGGGFNSDVFKSVYDESNHDIMMPFQFDGKQWTISLYTTKKEIDCSAIARLRGGGGHRQAAGFQVKDIKTVFDFI
jgi:oligoribonuclease NrnB/cAMP/cGMP phosphodiesterase (DHH superfamily)